MPTLVWEEEPVEMPPVCLKLGCTPPSASKSPDQSAVLQGINIKQFWKLFLSPDSTHYVDVHKSKGDRGMNESMRDAHL